MDDFIAKTDSFGKFRLLNSVWKFPWLRLNIDIDCFDHGLDRYLQDCAISISSSTIRCLTLTFCHKKLSILFLP